MEEIISAISEIVGHEIEDDKRVVPDGFIVSPFMLDSELDGDGDEEEISTAYQIDIFYVTKSEVHEKAKQLRKALKDVCNVLGAWNFTYESTVKLWRAYMTVKKLEVDS